MFEKFTDRARRAVVLAQEESRMARSPSIGTAHLLLGLWHEGEGVAYQVLNDLQFDYESLRRAANCGEDAVEPSGHIPFTKTCKKVLEYGLREALQLGHNWVGTEHLLLALCRLDGTELHEWLDADVTRKAVIAKLSEYARSDERLHVQAMQQCVARGGHCWEQQKPPEYSAVVNDTIYYGSCKHCPAVRTGKWHKDVAWEYPEGQP